jgi:hypothetical protein
MRSLRQFALWGCILPLLCHAAEPEPAPPVMVSLLNMRYGTLLVIYYKKLGTRVWGYTAFDYRQQDAGWKNWITQYNSNGTLTFKNPNTNGCLSMPDGKLVIHERCYLDNGRQQFELLLSRSGALQLRNPGLDRCLSTHNNDLPYAFTITHAPCVDSADSPVPDSQLWALIPAQGNSLSAPDARTPHQELRR